MLRYRRRWFALALAVGAVSIPAFAETWDSGGADSNFTSGLNWDTNAAPANNGTANLVFGSGLKLSPNVNAAFDVNSITFIAGSSAFSLGGSQLTIRNGGINNQSANLQSFTDPVSAAAGQSVLGSSRDLPFHGAGLWDLAAIT